MSTDTSQTTNAEPFFIAEVSGKRSSEERVGWYLEQAALAKKRGSVFVRVSYHPDQPDRLLFEGWAEWPVDQGELRWGAAS